MGFALSMCCFSLLGVYWGIGLAAVSATYFGVSLALRGRVSRDGYSVVATLYSGLFIWTTVTFMGVERDEVHECAYRVTADGVDLDLAPISFHAWVRVRSDPLSAQLRATRPPRVRVAVSVTRDFGNVRARGMIRLVDGFAVAESERADER